MRTRNSLSTFALALVAIALAGCASLGMPEPRDFADRASYAYDLAEQAAGTVDAMHAAGELSAAAAEASLDRIEDYRVAIDAARALRQVSASDAEARLAATRDALQLLIEELQERRADHE